MHPRAAASSVRIESIAAPSRSRSWLISTTVFLDAAIRRSSSSFAGTSRKLSGSSSSSTGASPDEQHLEHEPLALAARQLARQARPDLVEARRARSGGRPRPTAPPARSRRAPTTRRSPRPGACRRRRGRRRRPARARPRSSAPPPIRRRAGAGSSSSSRTVRPLVGADADVLGHVGERADVDVTVVGGQPPGQDAEQRRLADAVGPDQPDVLARRDAEGDLGEQQVAAGVGVGEVRYDDVRHPPRLCDAPHVTSERGSPSRTDSPVVRGMIVVAAMAALMWVVEAADQIAGGRLDRNGIEPRDLDGLDGIVLAPFLHAGFDHLIGNTIPFLLLGFAIALGGVARVAAVTVDRGARRRARHLADRARPTPCTSAPAGSSSATPAYLVARGIFSRSVGQIVLGVVVLAVWGTTLLRRRGARGRHLLAGPPVRRDRRRDRRAPAAPPRAARRSAGEPAEPACHVSEHAAVRAEDYDSRDARRRLPDRRGGDARAAGGRSASRARAAARARAGLLAARAGRLAGDAPRPRDGRDARSGDVHGRRPALLDRRRSWGRACSRSRGTRTSATATRSRGRSGSTPCASASRRRSRRRPTG